MELNSGGLMGEAHNLSGAASLEPSRSLVIEQLMFGFLHPEAVWEKTMRRTSQKGGPLELKLD